MSYDLSPAESLASIASLMGDPTRATILLALLDGCATTSGELAQLSGSSPQSTSNHLRRLAEGGLIRAENIGRCRAYRLASQEVAHVVEALAAFRTTEQVSANNLPRFSRVCYHHLAGQVGVRLAQTMKQHDWLRQHGTVLELTRNGRSLLRRFGLSEYVDDLHGRACLDLTEQEVHIGGQLGAEIYRRLLHLGWIAPLAGSCEVTLSKEGITGLQDFFALRL